MTTHIFCKLPDTTNYSGTPQIPTRLDRTQSPGLKAISFGFSLKWFTKGLFESPLLQTIFRFPCEFENIRARGVQLYQWTLRLIELCKGYFLDYYLNIRNRWSILRHLADWSQLVWKAQRDLGETSILESLPVFEESTKTREVVSTG